MRKRNILYFFLAISVLTILLLLAGILQDRPLEIDEAITGVFSHVPEKMNPLFAAITEMGDKKGIGIAALIMLLWLWFKRRDFLGMVIMALGVALGNEANKWLKIVIGRERPDLEQLVHVKTLSFPSGHAMVGSIMYFFIAYFLVKEYKNPAARRLIVIGAGTVILLIGSSRVILNVHYPTDIIGGYAFGLIWTAIWLFVYETLGNRYPRLRGSKK